MYEYAIKEVLRVVDGDTIDVVIDLGFDLTKKERIRLAGIDTPESRTRNLEEKKMGLEAKEYLQNKLDNCNAGFAHQPAPRDALSASKLFSLVPPSYSQA